MVVGGETNPVFHTTDYIYYKSSFVDKWVPKAGLQSYKKPLRMPASKECEDGYCLLG